jgi:hypothetical protein
VYFRGRCPDPVASESSVDYPCYLYLVLVFSGIRYAVRLSPVLHCEVDINPSSCDDDEQLVSSGFFFSVAHQFLANHRVVGFRYMYT